MSLQLLIGAPVNEAAFAYKVILMSAKIKIKVFPCCHLCSKAVLFPKMSECTLGPRGHFRLFFRPNAAFLRTYRDPVDPDGFD